MTLFGFLGHILELLAKRLLLTLENNGYHFAWIYMYMDSEQLLALYKKPHHILFQQCMHILKHVFCRCLAYWSNSSCNKEKCKSVSRPLKTDAKVSIPYFYQRWTNPVVYFFTKGSGIDDSDVDESEDEESSPDEGSTRDVNEESVKKTVEHSKSENTSEDAFKMKTDTTEVVSESPSASQTPPKKRKAESEKLERVKRSRSKEIQSENTPTQLEVEIKVENKMSSRTQSGSYNIDKSPASSVTHFNQGCDSPDKKYHRTDINPLPKNTAESVSPEKPHSSISPSNDNDISIEDSYQNVSMDKTIKYPYPSKESGQIISYGVDNRLQKGISSSQSQYSDIKSTVNFSFNECSIIPKETSKCLVKKGSCSSMPASYKERHTINEDASKGESGDSVGETLKQLDTQEDKKLSKSHDNIPLQQRLALNNANCGADKGISSQATGLAQNRSCHSSLSLPDMGFLTTLSERSGSSDMNQQSNIWSKYENLFQSATQVMSHNLCTSNVSRDTRIAEITKQFFQNYKDKKNEMAVIQVSRENKGGSIKISDSKEKCGSSAVKSTSVSSSSVEHHFDRPCSSKDSTNLSNEENKNAWKTYPGMDSNLFVKKDARYQKRFYKEKKNISLPPDVGDIIQWAIKKIKDTDSNILKDPNSDEEKLPLDKYRELARELAQSFTTAYNSIKEEKEKKMRDKKNSKVKKERPKSENMDYVESSFKEESPSDSSNDDSLPTSQDSPTKILDSPVPRAEIPSEYDLSLFDISPFKQESKVSPSFLSHSENLCPVPPSMPKIKDVLRLPCEENKSNPPLPGSSNMVTLQTIGIKSIPKKEIIRQSTPALRFRDVFYIPTNEPGKEETQRLSPLFRILKAMPASCSNLSVEEFLQNLIEAQQLYYQSMYEYERKDESKRFSMEITVCLIPLRQLQHHDDDYELEGDSLVPGSSLSNVVHTSPSFESNSQLVVLEEDSPEEFQGVFPTIVDQQGKSGKTLCEPKSLDTDKRHSHQRNMDVPSTSKLDNINLNIYGLDFTEIRVPKENMPKTSVNTSCKSNVLPSDRKANFQLESETNQLPGIYEADLSTSATTFPAETSIENQRQVQQPSTNVSSTYEVLFGYPSPELLGFPSAEKTSNTRDISSISTNEQRDSFDLKQFPRVVDVANEYGSENINKDLCQTNTERTRQLSTSQLNTTPRQDMLSPSNILELSPESLSPESKDDADTSLKELSEDESKNM